MKHEQNDKERVNSDFISSVYQVVANRRLGYDTLMWQVPAISFTAQAFLFSIALGPSNYLARFMAAFLAFVIACISMQLMSKHRHHEEIDSRLLEQFEKKQHIDMLFDCSPHTSSMRRAEVVGKGSNWIIRQSSYRLWMFGLTLFAITSITVIVIDLIDLLANQKLLP